ncbi:MAG: chemotaxis protein CheD [candidate division FCPU426 bacterium]
MKVNVGLSQMRLSKSKAETLMALGVGTGVGIALYDFEQKVGGMLHMMLPSARVYPKLAQRNPWMFADTGLPLFLEAACNEGGQLEHMTIMLAGGADLLPNGKEVFAIGKQNVQQAVGILKQNRLLPSLLEVGGQKTRSLYLNMGTGQAWVDTA